MVRKYKWYLAFLIPVVSLLGACSSSAVEEPAKSSVVWQECTDNSALECGSISVPIDYTQPDGEKTTVGMRRLVSDNADSKRILLLNPGGPGESAIDALNIWERVGFFPQSIRDEFSIIGFDPRGIGESNAVNCSDLEFNNRGFYFYPTTDTEIRNLVNESTRLADACFEKYGEYLLQLGTNNVVRDMEEIRKALAVEKLNFLGYSYGSRLGAVYLQTFPDSSGAFVLDGVVSPDSTSSSVAATRQLTGMARVLESLLAGCAPSSTACDGKELVQRLENRVNVLINALETEVLPDGFASLDQVNSEAFILIQIVQIAVSDIDIGFMLRAPLLTYIENFDIAPLEELLSTRSSNESDGNNVGDEDTDTDTDTEDATALFAVLCADDVERPTAESLIDLLPRMNAVSDFFAEANLSVAAYCSGWQPALSPLEPITTNVAPQALLIGGTADARTPIEMLSEMSVAIGGVAVTSDHIGHTVVFQGSSRCVDDLVVAFLTEGVIPTQLSCPFEE